jgi:putative hydrolase of the HAD superfamily
MTAESAKAIIFDLGKVLIDFSVDRACSQVAGLIGVSPKEIHSFLFLDGREFDFERGIISFEELQLQFQAHFGTQVNGSALALAASDIFQPIDDTIKILKSVRQQYLGQRPIMLLSNTNEIHWQHIQSNWGIHQWFDHLVLSYEVKSMKPEEKIYRHAIKLAGCDPQSCFFVDDVPANVDGAKKCGMDAVLYESPKKLIADLEMRGIQTVI